MCGAAAGDASKGRTQPVPAAGPAWAALAVLLRVRSTSRPGSKRFKPDQGCSGRAVTSQYVRAAHAFGGATRIAGGAACSGAVAFPTSPCRRAGTALGSVTAAVAQPVGGVGRSGSRLSPAGFTQTRLGLRGPRASSGTRANLCCLFRPPAVPAVVLLAGRVVEGGHVGPRGPGREGWSG